MGATNHTTNYNLSQFIGTDKPSWLNDYNGDMNAIDTAIKAAKDAADLAQTTATNAKNTADSASSTAGTLSTQINTPVTGIAAVQSDHTTAIGNIETEIGNTPLTTSAQTLTGAIEEVKGSIPDVSGITSFVRKDMIAKSYNGNTTVKSAMDSAYTDLVAVVTGLDPDELLRVTGVTFNNATCTPTPNVFPFEMKDYQNPPASISATQIVLTGSGADVFDMAFASSSSASKVSSSAWSTVNSLNSTTPASGQARIYYEVYKQLA